MQVERATGQKLQRQDKDCAFELSKSNGVQLYFADTNGGEVLWGILIYSSKYRTNKGIGIGSQFVEIERAYGKTQPMGDTQAGKRVYTSGDHYDEDNYIINLAPPKNALMRPHGFYLSRTMQFEIGKFNPRSRVKRISAGWILGTERCG